jgi:hypothetical protein
MHRTHLWLVFTLLVPLTVSAQDIPPYVPANPLLASRSALYGQSYILPRPGWQFRFVSDYYNAVEVSQTPGANPRQSSFDAEVLQADLWVTHDLTPRIFVLANLPIRGAYSGFLDGFLIWYHHLIGLAVPARDNLPRDTFQWGLVLPDTMIDRSKPGTFIGDLRGGIGLRLGRAEVIATATVPTATIGDGGWTRHAVGTSLALVDDLVRTSRLVVDASASAGITPVEGRLAKYQRSAFASGLLNLRWRFAGQQSVFGGIWAQSSNWKGTGFDAIDDAEVVTDFGFLLHVGRRWPELQLGMTQDLVPKGPALDVGFTVGLRW